MKNIARLSAVCAFLVLTSMSLNGMASKKNKLDHQQISKQFAALIGIQCSQPTKNSSMATKSRVEQLVEQSGKIDEPKLEIVEKEHYWLSEESYMQWAAKKMSGLWSSSSSTDTSTDKDWEKAFTVDREKYTALWAYAHGGKNYAMLAGDTKASIYEMHNKEPFYKYEAMGNARIGFPIISPDNTVIAIDDFGLNKTVITDIKRTDKDTLQVPFLSHKRLLQINDQTVHFVGVHANNIVAFDPRKGRRGRYTSIPHERDINVFLPLADPRHMLVGLLDAHDWQKYLTCNANDEYEEIEIKPVEYCHIVGAFGNYIVLWIDGEICVLDVPKNEIIYRACHDDEQCIRGLAQWIKKDGKPTGFALRTAQEVILHQFKRSPLMFPIHDTFGAIHFGPKADFQYIAFVQDLDGKSDKLYGFSAKTGEKLSEREISASSRLRLSMDSPALYAVIMFDKETPSKIGDIKQNKWWDIRHGGFMDVDATSLGVIKAFVVQAQDNPHKAMIYSVDEKGELRAPAILTTDNEEFEKLSEFDRKAELFVATTDKSILLAKVATGEIVKKFKQKDDKAQRLEFSQGNRYCAMSNSKELTVLDARNDNDIIVDYNFGEKISFAGFIGSVYAIMADNKCYFYPIKHG